MEVDRHTAATFLLERGISIRVVQQILGHSQLSRTERYTHVTTARLTQLHARPCQQIRVRIGPAK